MAMKNKELYGTCIDLDIYDDHINVLWGDIEKAKIITDVDYGKNIDGWVVNNDGIIYAYIGKTLRDKSTICHELTHAILELTYKRGILIDDEPGNQEHLAYLFGYVMGKVLSMKKKDWYIWKGTKKFECNFKK
jgi:Zn-dependent metalloprotease